MAKTLSHRQVNIKYKLALLLAMMALIPAFVIMSFTIWSSARSLESGTLSTLQN